MSDEHCENADILKEHREDSCIYCVKKSLKAKLEASKGRLRVAKEALEEIRDHGDFDEDLIEGRCCVHCLELGHLEDCPAFIAIKALAVIDSPDSKVPTRETK